MKRNKDKEQLYGRIEIMEKDLKKKDNYFLEVMFKEYFDSAKALYEDIHRINPELANHLLKNEIEK
jgi:hypothetical protein